MLERILSFKLLHIDGYTLTIYKILSIIIILVLTKLVLFFIKKTLEIQARKKRIDKTNIYTLTKILSYTIWIFSILIILNIFGIKLTALLTGSAALLVGVGLGLQQTFNDFVSGVILLFEGKTKINDIVEMDQQVLMLKNIGLRTTECIDRNGISVIIPNSKIVTDKVINWTYEQRKIRFSIPIGVAYGSDIELVVKLLEQAAAEHPEVSKNDKIEARFIDFGNSSLNFHLLFFSENIFRIERVKSEIRRNINLKFKQNNISIPFPQMDVYIKQNNS